MAHLYGTPVWHTSTVDHARHQLFGKAKMGLEMLPATRDAMERHTARANDQTNIWLYSDQGKIDHLLDEQREHRTEKVNFTQDDIILQLHFLMETRMQMLSVERVYTNNMNSKEIK